MTAALTPITTDSVPSQCIVMDTEISTQRSEGDPQGTYYAERVRGTRWRYEDGRKCRHTEAAALAPASWWDWVSKQCRRGSVTWLFAYDLLRQLRCNGFLVLLSSGKWQLTETAQNESESEKSAWHGFAVLADPPTILIVRAPGRRGILKMVDLRNYGVGKRSDIGPEPDWILYAERWVSNVVEWIRASRLGGLQCTAGSQSLHSFRRRFLDEPVASHGNADGNAIETGSFYGGRCECYRLGCQDGQIYHLDVNSLYPAACQDLALPVELLCVKEPREWQDPLSFPPGMGAIAEVKIKTDRPLYPVRKDGLIIYPIGEFSTVLAGPELTDACTYGNVLRFGVMSLYRLEPILSDYMDWLYSERLKAKRRNDNATEHFIKRLLVGLPGKFIQQDRRWVPDKTRRARRPWELWRELDEVNHEVLQFRSFGWQVQREEIGGFAKTAIPAIGAWITSAARVHMRDIFGSIPAGHLFYTDTDSVWVDQHGFDALKADDWLDEERLGALKIAGVHQSVDFRGIKYYIADGRTVRAGVSCNLLDTSSGKRISPAIRHVNADLALGQEPQPIDAGVVLDDRPIYRHGVVDENGVVRPFVLGGKQCPQT